jgi:hypothetical protein
MRGAPKTTHARAIAPGRAGPEPLTVRPQAWQYARKHKLTEGRCHV